MTATTLVSAKAAEELAKLRLLRHVVTASQSGMSQYEIADALGTTQPVVHRMLKKARLDPDAMERTTREIALEYAVHEISREQMLTELGDRDYTYGRAAEPDSPVEDAYLRGSWDEVTRAAYSRLITDDDYREITLRVERRRRRESA